MISLGVIFCRVGGSGGILTVGGGSLVESSGGAERYNDACFCFSFREVDKSS